MPTHRSRLICVFGLILILILAYTYSSGAAPGDITTVVGGLPRDISATQASIGYPAGICIDQSGNVYIAAASNHRVLKVDVITGNISVFAGVGSEGHAGDGMLATQAFLNSPSSVAIDQAGNLYISDSGNNRIRKVDANTGIISTVAGNGNQGDSGDGGLATQAFLSYPSSVVVDQTGNLYIADSGNNRIRKVDANTGIISTIAGNGDRQYSGDGGLATFAQLDDPSSVAIDLAGNIYIADSRNSRIRKVDAATGIISTFSGDGNYSYSGDGGPATLASFRYPGDVAIDGSGNLYIADTSNHRIRKVDAVTGIISTIAGSSNSGSSGDGEPATLASLVYPSSVAVGQNGNLYIADSSNLLIRKVDATTGVISTFAGNGKESYSGDGQAATLALLNNPVSVAFDQIENLYIVDRDNKRIRKVDSATGIISTVAGNGVSRYSGDGGLATLASFQDPYSVAVDQTGNLYIADSGARRIRKVNANTGMISTVAGNGSYSYSGDGGPATLASLWGPGGVTFDEAGNLYIAGINSHRIRKVDAATGIISTVAGSRNSGYSGDGGPAILAFLQNPSSVAIDGSGNLYIADSGNNRIRRVENGTSPDILAVDFEFRSEVTATYESYLDGQDDMLFSKVSSGGAEQNLSDRMGLILVKLAQIHVDLDRTHERSREVFDDLEAQMEEAEDLVRNELLGHDTESLSSFLEGLGEVFQGSRYEDFKRRSKSVRSGLTTDLGEIQTIWEDFQDDLENHLDAIETHLDVLKNTSGAFSVTFNVRSGSFSQNDIFRIERTNIDDLVIIENALRATSDRIQESFDHLRTVLDGGTDNAAVIEGLRQASQELVTAMSTLQTSLDRQPLSALGQNITQDIRTGTGAIWLQAARLNDILDGKTYTIQETAVRPLALLENLDAHPQEILLDFYRSSTPETYTFRGIFPDGAPPGLFEKLSVDLVMNTTASFVLHDGYMQKQREKYQARLAEDALDPEAHAILALIQTYFTVSQNHQNVTDLIESAIVGDVGSIANLLDTKDFDYRDDLETIENHIENALHASTPYGYTLSYERQFLVVLIKQTEDMNTPFEVRPGDDVVPLLITTDVLEVMLEIGRNLNTAGREVADAFRTLRDDASQYIDLDLDPNLLDFSGTDSNLDFALALQRSNSRFLQLTPAGISKLRTFGEDIKKPLENFRDAVASFRDLTQDIHEKVNSQNIKTEPLVNLAQDFYEFYNDLNLDFQNPNSTTVINGRIFNLSAWFDTPPDVLLQRFIWYLDDDPDTDNSLGGLYLGRAQEEGPPVDIARFDTDGDNVIGFRDFLQFASLFGKRTGDSPLVPQFDINGNGIIDFPDFIQFARVFGKEVTNN
ncbi:MAG: hypothetical protein O2954_06975 [bacterium]|nr:hypothetical protein [bacterium]